MCVCLFHYQNGVFLARDTRTIQSSTPRPPPPPPPHFYPLRTKQTKRENIFVHTLSGEILFFFFPNTLSAPLPLTNFHLVLLFSFDRALACSWYLNSFQFVISFPFIVFFSSFLPLRFVPRFLRLSCNSSPDTKLSYLSISKLIPTQNDQTILFTILFNICHRSESSRWLSQ